MKTYSLPDHDKLRIRTLKCRKLANAAHREQTREQLLQLAAEFDELAYKIGAMRMRSVAVARVFRKER